MKRDILYTKMEKSIFKYRTDEVYGSLKKDIPEGKELTFNDKDLDFLLENQGEVKTLELNFSEETI